MPVYRLMSNTLSNIANEEELAVVHSKDVVNILSYIHTGPTKSARKKIGQN